MEAQELISINTLRRLFRPGGRLLAFTLCVLVAAFLWLLTALTNQYKVFIDFDVAYQNAARYGVNEANLPQQLSIELEDYGYNIMGYKYRNKAHTVTIDLNEYRIFRNFKRNEAYVLLNYKPELISSQLSNEAKIIKIEPDTLFVNASERAAKKVPVILRSDFIYEKQYMQAGDIVLAPDSVSISGPKNMIERIDLVETEMLAKDAISGSFEERVKIARTSFGAEIQVSPGTVAVKVGVEEFTEGTLQVPIVAVNAPPGVQVLLVPDQVNIKYRVPLQLFKSISASDFKVVADCKNILTMRSDYLKVVVSKSPQAVSNAQIIDDKVRYLIKRK